MATRQTMPKQYTNNMASIASENDNSDDDLSVLSSLSGSSSPGGPSPPCRLPPYARARAWAPPRGRNLVQNVRDRQLYGRFARGPRAPLERRLCRPREYSYYSLVNEPNALDHTLMGFTQCGQYMLSYTTRSCSVASDHPIYALSSEYELYVWRFSPGVPLRFVSKQRIFSHFKSPYPLDSIMFMQFPHDVTKIVCYGNESATAEFFHITVLTLPASCVHCADAPEEGGSGGCCARHGFALHFMFAAGQMAPAFDPRISLSFAHHLVVNTGHHVHILNISTLGAFNALTHWVNKESAPDAFSEISESASCSSLVDALLEDFSEYDLEGGEGGKPFHELNISCEPLNVTGKTYHNTLVQSIFDPRLKRLQKPAETSKLDRKVAEQAYEFIEENEKYEKISLFRKKRLADKKYEFSEDNSENIVPFHIVRRERTFLVRPRLIKSPEAVFLSPSAFRRSPSSPRDAAARKVNAYSPGAGSDCSDADGRLVLRAAPFSADALLAEPRAEAAKWIKKVVRRFSNGDFENSSLLSGQSRDDYNNPIEVPLLVQSLSCQQSDADGDKPNHAVEVQLIVTQRSLDAEQFVQKQAQIMCLKSGLQFMHYEDYDLKIVHVCPMSGEILCQGVIKVGALRPADASAIVEHYWGHFMFVWNIATDAFDVLDDDANRLFCAKEQLIQRKVKCPVFHGAGAWVLAYDMARQSLDTLWDPTGHYKIVLQRDDSDEDWPSGQSGQE